MRKNRLFKAAFVSAFLLSGGLLLDWNPAEAFRSDRPLPVMVSVGELVSTPDQFDGQRVVVSGRVQSIHMQKGRRGGNYIVIRLESLEHNPKKTHPSIKVFSLIPPPVLKGHEALVQGKYHQSGRAGGIPEKNFINADAIMKEPGL